MIGPFCKKLIKLRLFLLILFLPAIFFASIYFTFLTPPDFNYLSEPLKINSYNDQNQAMGKSQIDKVIQSGNSIQMSYHVRKGYLYPYAGIVINRMSPHNVTDISIYNRLKFNLQAAKPEDLELYLLLNDKSIKDQDHPLSARHLKVNLKVTQQPQVFQLSFKDFAIPDWWLETFHLDKKNLADSDWKSLKAINLSVHSVLGMQNKVTIDSITFYKDTTSDIITYAMFHLAIILFYIIWNYIHIRKKEISTNVLIEYKAVIVENLNPVKTDFLTYIHENYHDPDLTLAKIEKATGEPARSISAYITNTFNTNFKNYLNQIRIAEAKRLLKNSDLSISEIAYKVGYNSPGSFNRVFKNSTNGTPTEFLDSIEF